MASLVKAYSNEYQEIIDAELAYDLYWAGLISNKSDFQCPSSFCNAKVTCINLDVEKQNMQKSAHFRGYNHSDECNISTQNLKNKAAMKAKGTKNSQIVSCLDNFCLNRPKNQFSPKQQSYLKKQHNNTNIIDKNPAEVGSNYYTVRSLVSKYIRFRQEQSLNEHHVKISGEKISYQTLFKGIYHQQLSKLPDTNFIYWGVAYINFLEDRNTYKFTFKETFNLNNKQVKPTFFISKKMINQYPIKNLIIKRIAEVSKQKDNRAFIFVYANPLNKNDKFVNFQITNLDFLEIRFLDLFEELKK